jgi:D-sedoheptulose 7-phosphate isomerase
MNLTERTRDNFNANIQLAMESQSLLTDRIVQAAELIVERLLEGGKVLSCGNGGSAGNAQHFAAVMINRYQRERPGLPALALTTDSSILTSISNDYDYDEVFAKQVRALGHPGDILLAITSSGNSENVNTAIQSAHEREMIVLALNGPGGGRLTSLLRPSDIEINVPNPSPVRTMEMHLLAIHCLCDLVDQQLLGG